MYHPFFLDDQVTKINRHYLIDMTLVRALPRRGGLSVSYFVGAGAVVRALWMPQLKLGAIEVRSYFFNAVGAVSLGE